MGIRVSFSGLPGGATGSIQAVDYSVEEAATPLAAGDSTGQVGSFSIVLPVPDRHVPLPNNSPWRVLRTLGPSMFSGSEVRIQDSRKGFTLGTINGHTVSDDNRTITFTGVAKTGRLNVHGVQSQPFSGTLRDAFTYYLSLANLGSGFLVSDEIANRPVVFPGWNGELWYHLKQMAAAEDCDISLVSGIILLRPIRERVAAPNRDTSRSTSLGGFNLAQAVEVYQYNNRTITNELVYPPGGWNPEVQVLNVNAGEVAEYTLELSSSLSSFQQPTMVQMVEQNYSASSVYTVVANDGLPIVPASWASAGGRVEISLGANTTTLEVKLTGATGLPTAAGDAASNFSIALGSDTTGNRYSTLRIVGTGVAFTKEKKRIRTGVTPDQTATDVGVTIDNPFISTTDQLYRTGIRAAIGYSGAVMSLSGTVISVNRRGDSGQVSAPTYDDVQAALVAQLGANPTYNAVQAYYTSLGLTTYDSVREYWLAFFRNDDADQVFGNVQGARVFDRNTRRWYRIRQATLPSGLISFSSADDDLTFDDMTSFYAGMTYNDVQALVNGLTYRQVELLGMYK